MRPSDPIERAIEQANCGATDATRRRIWQDVAGQLHSSQDAGQAQAPCLWRVLMRTKFVKPALAAVVLIAALAVGVETLRPARTGTANAFSAEIRANTALDLDPKAAIPLRKAQPEDFDVTWDGEAGGTLRILPGSTLRLLAFGWKNAEWDEAVAWAIASVDKIRESTATSVSPRQNPYAAILTSEGNLAVVRIQSYNESRASLLWRVESTASCVYGPVQTVTLGYVDSDGAATQPCAIDFDTGRTVSIPPQVLNLAPEDFLEWLQQNGVDAVARMSEDGVGLAGVELAFQSEVGLWGRLPATGLRGLMGLSSASHQSRDLMLFRENRYQFDYPFKTREGGVGILQMRGVDRVKRTVEFRYTMCLEGTPAQAETGPQNDSESAQLIQSGEWISRLGRSMLIYANDHEDRLPESLEEIKPYTDNEEQYRWYLENVEYLGAGLTVAQPPGVVVAYDRTLLAAGKGTNVLFLDSHIELVEPERFAKYGLTGGIEAIRQKNAETSERAWSERCLNGLGRALRFYANENKDRLPPSLEEIRKHIQREEQHQWLVENVQYLGAGQTFAWSPSQAVAYDRTLLAEGKGTNVLFLDGHTEFIESERLAKYGLPAGPKN